eukprot:3939470-Rhodomonas_salina.1
MAIRVKPATEWSNGPGSPVLLVASVARDERRHVQNCTKPPFSLLSNPLSCRDTLAQNREKMSPVPSNPHCDQGWHVKHCTAPNPRFQDPQTPVSKTLKPPFSV